MKTCLEGLDSAQLIEQAKTYVNLAKNSKRFCYFTLAANYFTLAEEWHQAADAYSLSSGLSSSSDERAVLNLLCANAILKTGNKLDACFYYRKFVYFGM